MFFYGTIKTQKQILLFERDERNAFNVFYLPQRFNEILNFAFQVAYVGGYGNVNVVFNGQRLVYGDNVKVKIVNYR